MGLKVYLSPSKQEHNPSAVAGASEEQLMAPVADACRRELERWGFEVRIHAGRTIQEAEADAEAWGADFYVAIHSNAARLAEGGQARGTETYYHSPGYPGETLAACVHDSILRAFPGTVDRGIKDLAHAPVPYYEVVKPTMTSVLVETLFHDHRDEALLLWRAAGAMGRAIAEGCLLFAEWRWGGVSEVLARRLDDASKRIPKGGVVHGATD